jgi:hypothetical protein
MVTLSKEILELRMIARSVQEEVPQGGLFPCLEIAGIIIV